MRGYFDTVQRMAGNLKMILTDERREILAYMF